MKKIRNSVFLIAILIGSFTSCTTEKNTSNAISLSDGSNIDTNDINSTIILVDSPEMANTHINGDVLSLRLINQSSNETINFNGDFDLNLLVQNNKSWLDGINAFYYPDDQVKLYPTNQDPVGLIVNASPYIKDITSPKVIRIIVSGLIESQNSLVAAFLDITIFP